MNLNDQFKCLVECYYGVAEMDEYDLKVYILKDIENIIRNFVKEYKLDIDYCKNEAKNIKDNTPLKTKLQSSLITLNDIDAPMELILLIKNKIKDLNK